MALKHTVVTPTSAVSLLAKKDIKTPKVLFSATAWETISYLVRKCDQEVGWLGTVEKLESGNYLVSRIIVPEQTVSGTETDISAQTIASMLTTLVQNNICPSTVLYWGHSHVNMGVSPSGQDNKQMLEFLETAPVFIRSIHNKSGEYAVDVYDTEACLVFYKVEVRIDYPGLTAEQEKELDEIIDKNVKSRYPTYVGRSGIWDYPGYYNDKPLKKNIVTPFNNKKKDKKKKKLDKLQTAIWDNDDDPTMDDLIYSIVAVPGGFYCMLNGTTVKLEDNEVKALGFLLKDHDEFLWKGKYECLDGVLVQTLAEMFRHNADTYDFTEVIKFYNS